MAKSGMIKQQIRLVLNYNPKYKIKSMHPYWYKWLNKR